MRVTLSNTRRYPIGNVKLSIRRRDNPMYIPARSQRADNRLLLSAVTSLFKMREDQPHAIAM
jgi:hypothetical protein